MVCRFVSGVPSGRTSNYPESGRGLGHVTPTIFGIRSNISLKLLELETSNLIHGFVWAMPIRRTNNFPESRRGLGHVNHTIFGSTVGYPSDSLASFVSPIQSQPHQPNVPMYCSF